jgi:hypothetical protein
MAPMEFVKIYALKPNCCVATCFNKPTHLAVIDDVQVVQVCKTHLERLKEGKLYINPFGKGGKHD